MSLRHYFHAKIKNILGSGPLRNRLRFCFPLKFGAKPFSAKRILIEHALAFQLGDAGGLGRHTWTESRADVS
jgi:hypothetical protein